MSFFIGWVAVSVAWTAGYYHVELGMSGWGFLMIVSGVLTQVGRER